MMGEHDQPTATGGRRHARRQAPASFRLHVRLEETFPPVWRRIEVASDLGLDDLHDVLQVVYGWEDRHLHRFTTGPQLDPGEAFLSGLDLREAEEDDQGTPEWEVRLDEVLGVAGERLHYQYDYGDNWWLTLELEDIDEGRTPPGRVVCLEGAGAEPPEDCGGPYGYELIVGSLDRDHPEHRDRRAEFADIYGEEVDPAWFRLVLFDADAVTARLARLDLDARPATPSTVGPALASLFVRARSWQTHLHLRALAAAADAPAVIGEHTGARMTHPYRWLVDHLGEDGIKLTAAGYLPPAHVEAAFEELDMAEEWIGAGNREDLTLPVLGLRETARQLGLIRKYRGRLLPTARGRTLASDPVAMWQHLVSRMPIGARTDNDAEWQAGVLLLGAMATGSTDGADVDIASALTGLGWAQGDGMPIDRFTVIGLTRDDVSLLRRIGALTVRGPWPGHVTPDGVAFARAALAAPRA